MTRILAASLLVLLAAGTAQAQRVSNVKGTTLMKACTGSSSAQCDAYVDGFSDPISASGKFIRQYPSQTKEFVGILAKVANWGNAHPEEYRDIVARLTGLPKDQVTKYYYANNLILDKEQTGFWWGLAQRVGTLTPAEAALKPDDIATNEYNPYAKSPALIDSQAQNTEILTDGEI